MTRMLPLLAAAALALSTLAASADSRAQLERSVAHELRFYASDVEVGELTDAQLHSIHSILFGPYSQGEKHNLIRGVTEDSVIRNFLRRILS